MPVKPSTTKKASMLLELLRTRARRVIRAAYDALYPHLSPGYDLIFVARGKTPHVKSTVVQKAMRQQLMQAGVLRRNNGDAL